MPIRILKREVNEGERISFGIPAGRLPTGRQMQVRVEVIRGQEQGPTVLLLGGMHGDEFNGVDIVRRILVSEWIEKLVAGTLIAIPLLNIYGFINRTREAAGGKDINRSFPGSSRGSAAARLAAILSKRMLPLIDWGIDFHSGSGQIYNYPQIRYSPNDPIAKDLANDFGAPFLVPKAPIPKSMRKVFMAQQKPMLIYEGGEDLRLDAFSVGEAVLGFRRLLTRRGMLQEDGLPARESLLLDRSSWQRATASGLFQPLKTSGQQVEEGEPLGFIYSPFYEEKTLVKAKKNGHLIGHSNAAMVHQGDALFHLGYPSE